MKLADGREVEIDEAIDGVRYNAYGCPGFGENATRVIRAEGGGVQVIEGSVAHWLLSMDVDEGVTPMFVHCPDDGQQATSRGYPPGPPPEDLFPVRMVWRRPTNGELKRELRTQGRGGHYASGGLAREWTANPSPISAWKKP